MAVDEKRVYEETRQGEGLAKVIGDAISSRVPAREFYLTCNAAGYTPQSKFEIDWYEQGRFLIEQENALRKKEQVQVSVPEKVESRRYIPGRDFYIPKHAYELREWVRDYCRITKKELPKGLSKMRKKQLYAIYFGIREEQG